MSYSEENGQVVLTMHRCLFENLMTALEMARDAAPDPWWKDQIIDLCTALNSGNPHYTPYQVEEKKP